MWIHRLQRWHYKKKTLHSLNVTMNAVYPKHFQIGCISFESRRFFLVGVPKLPNPEFQQILEFLHCSLKEPLLIQLYLKYTSSDWVIFFLHFRTLFSLITFDDIILMFGAMMFLWLEDAFNWWYITVNNNYIALTSSTWNRS